MKSTKFNLLVFIVIAFVTNSFSQQPKNYEIHSGFALGGGITKYTINTDNFKVSQGSGWFIKASTTADIPHKWFNLTYGMHISNNKFNIAGRMSNTNRTELPINYKTMAAQLYLLWHAKLFDGYFSFDFGPMLQYNGNLELESTEQETYLVNNFENIKATDILEVSNLQLIPAIGCTAGISHFKISLMYLYSISNMFGKLNKKELDVSGQEIDFKGNQSMVLISGMFTFN